jgi:hypothetical protein
MEEKEKYHNNNNNNNNKGQKIYSFFAHSQIKERRKEREKSRTTEFIRNKK